MLPHSEIRLARAKIAQAMIDLKAKDELLRYQTEVWIFSNNSDFHLWCDSADLNAQYVRQRAKEIIDSSI
jgi:hypothetical protein